MFCPSSARVEIAMSRAQEQPEHRITSSEVTLETRVILDEADNWMRDLASWNADVLGNRSPSFHRASAGAVPGFSMLYQSLLLLIFWVPSQKVHHLL